jgi:hypothetical protein
MRSNLVSKARHAIRGRLLLDGETDDVGARTTEWLHSQRHIFASVAKENNKWKVSPFLLFSIIPILIVVLYSNSAQRQGCYESKYLTRFIQHCVFGNLRNVRSSARSFNAALELTEPSANMIALFAALFQDIIREVSNDPTEVTKQHYDQKRWEQSYFYQLRGVAHVCEKKGSDWLKQRWKIYTKADPNVIENDEGLPFASGTESEGS